MTAYYYFIYSREMRTTIPRLVNISKILGKTGSGLLLGPRGAGKTRLADAWLAGQKDALAYNLLNVSDLRRLRTDPQLFVSEIEAALGRSSTVLSVLVDEVQKFPDLLDLCHLLIEKHKGSVRFLLTGSSARKLKTGGANLLAGRAYTIRLHPLTVDELTYDNQPFDLISALTFGTTPGIIFAEDRELALQAYVDMYLREEIQQEAIVRKLDRFFRFIDLAAQLNGEPVNFRKFARQIGVSDKTTADYFQILVDTLLVLQLPGWDRSHKKQILKSPKFYFFDCGVLNAAARELKSPVERSSSRFGKLFEQFVINEFYRMNDYYRCDYALSYYGTGTVEVDLVLSRSRTKPPIAVEIKSNEVVHREDLNGLELFSAEYPEAKLYCVSTNIRPYSVELRRGQRVEVIPYQQAAREVLGVV
jgi:uncharacterized protein